MDKNRVHILQLVDPLIELNVCKNASSHSYVPTAGFAHPVADIGRADFLEDLLHAGRQVLSLKGSWQGFLNGLDCGPVKDAALIYGPPIFIVYKPLEKIGMNRFSVSSQPRDLSLMLLSFEAADVGY